METDEIILTASIYILLAIFSVTAEHYTFGRWWAGNELARRTLGIITIMALAVPFILSGVMDFVTWLLILAAFGAAGATKAGLTINERERSRSHRGQIIREQIDGTINERGN